MSEELLEIPTFLKKLSERDKKEKPQKSKNQKQTKISEIDGSLLELRNGFWWAVKTEDSKKSRLAECVSIGWLFREDDKKYVLIADITEGEEGGRVTVIPKGWIKKIEWLVTSHSTVY